MILSLFFAPLKFILLFFVPILYALVGLIVSAIVKNGDNFGDVYWISFFINIVLVFVKAVLSLTPVPALSWWVYLMIYVVLISITLGRGDRRPIPVTGNPYGGNPYAGNTYGGNPYAGNTYGGNQYGGNQNAGNQYGGNQYGGNQYGGNQNGGNQYGGNQYGGNQYGGSQDADNQYGSNPYGANQNAGNANLGDQNADTQSADIYPRQPLERSGFYTSAKAASNPTANTMSMHADDDEFNAFMARKDAEEAAAKQE